MFGPLIAAAAAALLCASPALASPAGDTLRTALYTGALADGLGKLTPQAAAGDPEAAFGAGALKLTQAIEHLTQTLYRHGFDVPGAPRAGITAGIAVPQNPNPEPFDYAGVRQMLSDLVAGLDDARASFDLASKGGDYVIELEPLKIRIDANGDGRADDGESVAAVQRLFGGEHSDTAPGPSADHMPFERIGFDRADAYWLAGYAEVLAAQADFLLSHDFTSFTDATFHRFFPKAGFPMQAYANGNGTLLMGPETDTTFADVIAAIHTIDWPVTDAAKLSGVRDRLKAIVSYSRQDWDAILGETDDDHELLPSPKQTPPLPDAAITDERVVAWRATLDEADKILDGKLLVPHWRFKQGFDLKAYFDGAKRTDLVMLLTGADAVPFLRDGPVASAEDFRAVQAAFGNDWLGYAFWFN